MNASKLFALSLTALALAGPPVAGAATRTVCFELKIADDRTNCPVASTPGSKRACNPGANIDAVGHVFELWDKDDAANAPDEYIGKWVIGGTGRVCATFEWENSPGDIDLGEDNPDVYVRYINRVNRTTGGAIYVQGVDTDGSSVPVTSWRDGDDNDPDAYVAEECTTGHNCDIVANGSLIPESDTASERGMRIQALDSAQHALETYGAIMDTSVELHYPGKAGCEPSCFVSRSEVHVAEAFGDDAFYPTHELGHAVQMQEFNQDYLRDVCGGSHTLTSSETDSCSTTEGWADYVAVVSWYEPNNKNSKPQALGYKFEAAAPYASECEDNRGIELQVARAFWDLDDAKNEEGQAPALSRDYSNYTTRDIARGWRNFEDGTDMYLDDYYDDDNGVNMYAYYYNNWYNPPFTDNVADFLKTLVDHNCLQYQESFL
jgi:hypothetical protein